MRWNLLEELGNFVVELESTNSKINYYMKYNFIEEGGMDFDGWVENIKQAKKYCKKEAELIKDSFIELHDRYSIQPLPENSCRIKKIF